MSEETSRTAWCPGFREVTLDPRFSEVRSHHYLVEDSGPYLGPDIPRPCPECAALKDRYMLEMERMDRLLREPAARPTVTEPEAEDIVPAQREPEYALA